MAEITYRGGQMDGVTSNAASEATLQRLVQLMEKGSTGGGSATEKMANAVKTKGIGLAQKDNKATQEGTEATQKQTKATTSLTQKTKNFAKTLDRYSGGLLSGVGNTISAVGGLGKELVAGGNRISDFGQHVTGLVSQFPIVGGVLGQFGQTMLNVLDNQIDMYRSLSNGGIDFGDDLFSMQRRAAEAGLSMSTLAGSIQENSSMLALAFGGATTGADRFSKISKYVQQSQAQFSALGMTMEDVTEFTADYIELQKVQGRLGTMTDRQLAKGTQNYIMQLDQLAKVTGMTRKQAAEELQSQATDKRLQALISNMDEGVKTNLQNSLAMMKNMSPEMKDAMTELVATNGVALTPFTEGLLRTNPQFAEMARGLRSGSITADEFATQTNEQIAQAQALVKQEKENIGTYAAMGVTAYDAALSLAKAGTVGGKLSDAQQKQLDATTAKNKTLTNFDSAIEKVRSKIMIALLDSGVFTKVQSAMSKLTTWFESDKIQTSIQGFTDRLGILIDNLGSMFQSFKDDWGKLSIGELVTKYLIDPIRFLFGGKPKTKASPGSPGAEAGDDAGGSGGTLMGSMFESLGPIITKFEEWGKALMWGGIGAAAVLLGVAAAIGALAGPINLAVPGVLAIGLAFAGIGVAGYGIAALIDSITSGVGTLADGVKKFEGMDAKKLLDVGKSLGPLTDNMMGLAKGGLVASFISDGALEGLSDGVKSFEGINPKTMSDLGPALESLQKGVSAFTGNGFLDSAGKFFSSFFGNDGNLDVMAKKLESFADVDAAGLKNIGDGLQGIAAYVEAMDDANLRQVTKNIKELIKQIAEYNEEYKNMDAETKASFTKVLNVSNESQDKSASMLVSLNSTNALMLEELKKQTRGGKQMNDALGGAA